MYENGLEVEVVQICNGFLVSDSFYGEIIFCRDREQATKKAISLMKGACREKFCDD